MISPEIQEEYNETLERTGGMGLLDALGKVSPVDREHSERVGQLAMQDAAENGSRDRRVIESGVSGALHDTGKVHPDVLALIGQARRLDLREVEEVRQKHTNAGALLIRGLEAAEDDKGLLETAAKVALYHHHTPEELRKSLPYINIPTSIIRRIYIIDQFDAMTDGERPYHLEDALSPEEALEKIEVQLSENGNGFDSVAAGTIDFLKRSHAVN